MLDHFHYPVETKIWGRLDFEMVSIEVIEVAECARSSMDRASDFGSEGWGFKSLRAHQYINKLCVSHWSGKDECRRSVEDVPILLKKRKDV
jgi:hypothetical protein